jgi:hypothetical protein
VLTEKRTEVPPGLTCKYYAKVIKIVFFQQVKDFEPGASRTIVKSTDTFPAVFTRKIRAIRELAININRLIRSGRKYEGVKLTDTRNRPKWPETLPGKREHHESSGSPQ